MKRKFKISISKLDDNILEQLARYESNSLALSLFLSTQVKGEPFGKIKTEIDSLIAEANTLVNDSAIEKKQKNFLKNQLKEAKKFLWTYKIPENVEGLALYLSCEKNYLLNLPFKIKREAKLKRNFQLKHLLEMLSRQITYAVLLADRTEGRIIIMKGKEIIEATEIIRDDVPRKTKSGEKNRSGFGTGGARSHDLISKKIDRHIEWHLKEHFQKLARMIFDNYWKTYKFRYLLIGTHEDMKNKLRKTLHSYLRRNTISAIWSAEPSANIDDLRKQAGKIFLSIQQKEDNNQIKKIAEEIGRPHIGVSGLDETLNFLNQGRLGIIYVSKNLNKTGYYTKDYFNVEVYPRRGKEHQQEEIFTLDLADAIARKAILTKTKLKFSESKLLLDRLGGLAGIFKKY